MKRAASRAAAGDSPAKLSKKTTSATLGATLSRRSTSRAPPPAIPRFPTLKPTGPLPDLSAFGRDTTTPSLRRAPTVTVGDASSDATGTSTSDAPKKAPSRTPSRAASRLSAAPSLKKTTSKLEGKDIVTSIKRLPSGSSVGETTGLTMAPPEVRKELSGASSLKKAASLAKSASVRSKAAADDAGEATSDAEAGSSLPSHLPPGGLMEIVFSFDTTGSMGSVLDQVRGRVQDMIQRLQADIPSIRIAVFAHGDYCDAATTYVTKWIDFGASVPELCGFVKNIERTGGGDADECYELVLRQVQEELSWTPGSQRSLVMIGDAMPHPPNEPQNKLKIDWEVEVKKLADMGVKIYAVQANRNMTYEKFYKTMASETGGRHLELAQFQNIFDIIMAICYCEHDAVLFSAYEDEVRGRHAGGTLPRDLEGLFGTLRDPSAPVPITPTKAPGKAPGAAIRGKGKGAAKATAKVKAAANPKGKGKGKGAGSGSKATSKKGGKTSKKHRGKQLRETVGDKAFKTGLLKRLSWTAWKHVMSTSNPSSPKQIWRARASSSKSSLPGWRRFKVFTGNETKNCLYEVAVSSGVGKRPRKYVMHYVPAQKLRSDVISALLRNKPVAKEVDALMKAAPSDLFVRCGVFKSTRSDFFKKVLKHVQDNFNYAWRAKPHRTVRMRGRILSGNA